ncbi:MAG: hypothetical protein A3F42_07260 [Gammaproteobacteria bacterium RIFCSPHIGHO2_12_FULL_37_34]|nr:MAG: hypothetical protein A3F42_07260 [Gammaproteobacteria bacterium RIFCSPHIGHO2_12_FULL_37_34]
MQIREYANKIYQRVESLFEEKKLQATTFRCCLSLTAHELSFIYLNHTQDFIEVLLSETLSYESIDDITLLLTGLVKQQNLHYTPTSWLLSPDDYQLFLVEALPVKPEEYLDALKWRIRSLINYDQSEAAIDYFKLPVKKGAQENNAMTAAVVAQKSQLNKLAEALNHCGLLLTAIDIPELAMRNLTALYEHDEKSTAFIYFYPNVAILNITREKTLYFTRRINLTEYNDQQLYEQVSLDILRYFDYYQSQWRHPNPSRIFVASKNNVEQIKTLLSQYLSLAVEPYQLPATLMGNAKFKTLGIHYLLLLGKTLGQNENNAKTRN